MKETLRKAVEEVQEKMGDLKGFILIAIDEEKQVNNLVGPYDKMIAQVAEESEEVRELFEKGIKAAKVRLALNKFLTDVKEAGLIDEDKLRELAVEDEKCEPAL